MGYILCCLLLRYTRQIAHCYGLTVCMMQCNLTCDCECNAKIMAVSVGLPFQNGRLVYNVTPMPVNLVSLPVHSESIHNNVSLLQVMPSPPKKIGLAHQVVRGLVFTYMSCCTMTSAACCVFKLRPFCVTHAPNRRSNFAPF